VLIYFFGDAYEHEDDGVLIATNTRVYNKGDNSKYCSDFWFPLEHEINAIEDDNVVVLSLYHCRRWEMGEQYRCTGNTELNNSKSPRVISVYAVESGKHMNPDD